MAGAPIDRIRLAGRLPEPLSHYTDAVRAGDTLYISGMLGFDPSGEILTPGDVVAQADQALRNVGLVLESLGLGFDAVVKVVIYVLDIGDRMPINAVRRRHFGDTLPASTLVEVSALAHPDARVEIEAVAHAPATG